MDYTFNLLLLAYLQSIQSDNISQSCTPRDTCSENLTFITRFNSNSAIIGDNDFVERNCFCDRNCIVYDDCCADAPIDSELGDISNNEFVCSRLRGTDTQIYIWSKCSENWGDDDVKELCEKELDELQDPILGLPVSSLKSNITFKNLYCAICNRELGFSPWEIQIGCGYDVYPESDNSMNGNFTYPSKDIEMLKNVKYNTYSGKWDLKYQVNGNFPSCSMSFRIPKEVHLAVRKCKPAISQCTKNWTDEIVRAKCEMYTAFVYQYKIRHSRTFKNIHCALCNYVNISNVDCYDEKFIFVEYYPLIFSFPPNFNYESGAKILNNERQCDVGFVFDCFAERCRRVSCPRGFNLNGTTCIKVNETEHIFLKFHRSFCPKFAINKNEFHFLSDEIIYVNLFNKTYHRKNFKLDNNGGVLICDPKFNARLEMSAQCLALNKSWLLQLGDNEDRPFIIFRWDADSRFRDNPYCDLVEQSITVQHPCVRLFWQGKEIVSQETQIELLLLKNITALGDIPFICQQIYRNTRYVFTLVQKLVTIILLLLSLLCLLLNIVAFFSTSLLKTDIGKIILSQVATIILKQLCCILSVIFHINTRDCKFVGIIFHFSFVASYFWMAVLIYDIWRELTQKVVTATRKQSIHRMFIYSCFAWGLPIALEILILIIDQTSSENNFKAKFGYSVCWISQRMALLLFFGIPLAITLAIILIFISMTGLSLLATWQYPTSEQKSHRQRFIQIVTLSFIMNCTWISMFIATYTYEDIWWFVFVIFNSLQGIFIFFAFTYTSKMKTLLRIKYKEFRNSKMEQRDNEINTAYVVSDRVTSHTNS